MVKVSGAPKSVRSKINWVYPPREELKFNIDGSFVSNTGMTGLGGILRDSEANVKAVFSKAIGKGNANFAELLAIHEAFMVFGASQWPNSKTIIQLNLDKLILDKLITSIK
ncbi:hypothetical protein PTKIN_Ptkin13bG0017900 [Pterospermum kingtungense]